MQYLRNPINMYNLVYDLNDPYKEQKLKTKLNYIKSVLLLMVNDQVKIDEVMQLLEKNLRKIDYRDEKIIDNFINLLLLQLFMRQNVTRTDEEITKALEAYPESF